MKKDKILNSIIYVLFFVIVIILGTNCYILKSELKNTPQIVWKEYNTTEYIEKPVEKVVYKTIYKDSKDNKDVTVDYENNDGALILEIINR